MSRQRRHTRALAAISVIDTEDRDAPVYWARDISVGGLYLRTGEPWPLDLRRVLTIEHKGERIEVEARVVRTDAEGVALQFEDPPPTLRTRIRALLIDLVYDGAPLAEKRRAPRFDTTSPVLWSLGSAKYRSNLINLSPMGAIIRAERPPEIGSQLHVQLPIVETRGGTPMVEEVHGCAARVVRHTDEGFAVEFRGASDGFRSAIRSWEGLTTEPKP